MRVKRGDLIIKSKPFVYKLSIVWRGKRCETCLQAHSSLKKCIKCKVTFYCSKQCQRADWNDHKHECDNISAFCPKPDQEGPQSPSNAADFLIMLSRIIQKLQRGGDKESETIGNVKRTFADLMSHSKEIRSDKTRFDVIRNAYIGLVRFLGCKISFDEVVEIAGKMIINSLSIMEDLGGTPLGTGLYLGPSVIDHSCQSNAYYVFDGPNLILRSVVDHEDFDISKVFVPYIEVLDVKAVRQKALLEQYYFDCKCAWCEDSSMDKQMKAIRCEQRTCREPVYIQNNQCSKCGTPVTPSMRSEALAITKKLEECILNARKMKTGEKRKAADALNALRDVMDRAEHILHPVNVTYMKGADEVFDMSVFKADFEGGLTYGLTALQGYRAYHRGVYPMFASHLAKIGEVQLYLGHHREGREHLQEALDILETLFGEAHKHTKRVRDLLG